MQTAMQLAYLAFAVRKPAKWSRFCTAMLGLPAPVQNSDGSQGFRLDDHVQRLIVQPGDADDLVALGFECGSDGWLDAVAQRLRASGGRAEPGDPALARARRVRRLLRAVDPAGNAVELCVGSERASAPFVSTAVPGGYRAGDLGLGHAVLIADDLKAMERFYVGGLGFGVSERLDARIGPIALRGVFLHCNRRHHSLAIFDMPWRRRLHHFMLQANTMEDVGTAFERAARLKVPLSLGLGQHPDPDGTFSFYGRTPSGFEFEIGAGSKEIDPPNWQPLSSAMASTWGHKPQLQLRLRIATAMLARRLGGRRPSAAVHGSR